MKKVFDLCPTFWGHVAIRLQFRAEARLPPSLSRAEQLFPIAQESALSLPWRARRNSEVPLLCIFAGQTSQAHKVHDREREAPHSVLFQSSRWNPEGLSPPTSSRRDACERDPQEFGALGARQRRRNANGFENLASFDQPGAGMPHEL